MPRTLLERSDAVRALAGVFRRRGFESSSLSVIQQEAGIGRGSLYHFFPDGKTDMARAVLDQVSDWFEDEVFAPLRSSTDAAEAVSAMTKAVSDYFVTRENVCLFAAMTLGEEKETFADEVKTYFADWIDALTALLQRGGLSPGDAHGNALDAVAVIQGGLILTRAYSDETTFLGVMERVERRLLAQLN
ncbi:TetR/AcrR family transcriptional regulator [Paenarthrobacter sp. JL.01a]|uniref:TetR/AcrR family transcriptional regulator n=1 Tax=Paenarthrobacter sp. JL.01a TaxID=2979324 RepID=UPI0021C65032|nr:TetR/AcrR family transcriptional regulator [Paenarthrobacter sp. JL.01a]UXM90792.1 TetR/AcrR family transcriptional regulator [Paenarthrobacter sp. JL.01a]